MSRSDVMYKQSSLEKTLLRFYQKKFDEENLLQQAMDCSSGTFIEFFQPGATTYNTAPLRYTVNNPYDESFATVCWESFQSFAVKPDNDESIGDDLACIPIIKLGKAMQKIMYTITPAHVNSVADYFGLLEDKSVTLSWNDFKQFINQMLETLPIPPLAPSVRLSDKNADTNIRSVSSDQIYQSNDTKEVRYGENVKGTGTGTVYISSLSNLPGLNASKNFAKEEMLGIFRREELFRRQMKAENRAGEI